MEASTSSEGIRIVSTWHKFSLKSVLNRHRGERLFFKNETPLAAFFRKKAEELKRNFRQCFLPGKFYLIVTISLAAPATGDYGDHPANEINWGLSKMKRLNIYPMSDPMSWNGQHST